MKAITIAVSARRPDALSPLSARQEQMLCRRWYQHHDVAAAEQLIGNCLHLVVTTAVAHRDCGILTQELIGEGYVGLMRAACRYDPACRTAFSTYATEWIRASIQRHILCASGPAQVAACGTRIVIASPPPYPHGNRPIPTAPSAS